LREIILLITAKILSYKNSTKQEEKKKILRFIVFFAIGLLFWFGTFLIFYKVLSYFSSIEVVGTLLSSKLLSMVFLTFFSLLVFSNVITALSTYFLADDLQLLNSLPIPLRSLYAGRFVENIVNSSWTVLFFSFPVFLAYGLVYNVSLFYYLTLLMVLVPFLLISAAIGTILILLLVYIFPARRLKDIILLASLLLVVGVFLFIRLMQPEQLVDPESFYLVMDYITNLKAPASPLIPSQWATNAISHFLFGHPGDWWFFVLLLWSTGLAFALIGEWIFEKIYYDAWSKAQEAKAAKLSRSKIINYVLERLCNPLPPQMRVIILKDIRVFLRDTTQWPQLFLICALIIIYIYNFSVLPLEKSPMPTFYLQNMLSFINLGLAAFVISAIAVRFTFPSISLEGRSFWILKSSPVDLRKLVWSKFWMNFFFLLIPAEILIITTDILMNATSFMIWLSAITIGGMIFGITSLGIGLGAYFPRFKVENVSQIATGFGGMLYMITAVSFIGLVVILEARPVYLFFMSKLRSIPLTGRELAEIITLLSLVLVVNVVAFILPMKLGLRKLSSMEF
jgi:ABC-2 type transport system permease protein